MISISHFTEKIEILFWKILMGNAGFGERDFSDDSPNNWIDLPKDGL